MKTIYQLDNAKVALNVALVFFVKNKSIVLSEYPLALSIIAGILRHNNIHVTICVEEISTCAQSKFEQYDVVAIYPMAATIIDIINLLNSYSSPSFKTVLFNSDQYQHEMILCSPKASLYAVELMNSCSKLDYILLGECEYSFLKLMEVIFNRSSCKEVPMLMYRNRSDIVLSKKESVSIDFSILPRIQRDYLEYEVNGNLNSFSTKITSSRGCPSGCLYCSEASVNIIDGGRKKPVIEDQIDRFIDEIVYLQTEYKVIFFNIIDSSFESYGNQGIERMRYFCNEIISRKINASFKIHLRIATIGKLDKDFLILLKNAGVDVIITGVESGVERELFFYTKKTSLLKNSKNVDYIDLNSDFFVLLGHMMFSPFLRLEDLYSKIDYLYNINRAWDFLNISNNLIVYRGTKLHDLIRTLNLEKPISPIHATIPYSYEDQRVELVSELIGELKIKSSLFLDLNTLIYDSLNLLSRYKNKLNSEFHIYEKEFFCFNELLDNVKNELSELYFQYFVQLVQDIEKENNNDVEIEDRRCSLYKEVKGQYECLSCGLDELLTFLEKKKLPFNKLYLKTWTSSINKANTASGEV